MNAAERAQVLSRSRVFANVPRSDLAVLAEMMKVERYPASSTVTETGEAADRVYVVASGTVSVYVGHATEPVRTMDEGAVIGEYGMVTSAVRTATVRADATEAVLLSLDYERFREYLLRFPEALWVLFEGAAKRLVEAEQRR